LSISAIVLQ